MAFDGTNNCWIPDVPFSEIDEWRLRRAQFSDGYEQRTLDGINALNRSWNLSWVNRKSSIVNNMLAFLANKKAAAFTFHDVTTGIQWQVFCDKWQVDWGLRRRGGIYYGTLRAEFYKANGAAL